MYKVPKVLCLFLSLLVTVVVVMFAWFPCFDFRDPEVSGSSPVLS